jgi:hypothetical protein
MACSTCMAVRRAVNVPLQRMGLPTLPVPAAPQPVAAATQRTSNPAWPSRKP